MSRRHSGPAPAPVATLPPLGPGRSVPFSMPESVPFSMPIDTRRAAPPLGPVSPAAKITSGKPGKPAPKSPFILLQPRETASRNASRSVSCRFTPWNNAPVAYSLVLGLVHR